MPRVNRFGLGIGALWGMLLTSPQCLHAQVASITVNPDAPGRVIPYDFNGLSLEYQNLLGRYFGTPTYPNHGFFQLIRNLGAGTLRLGGNSTDDSCWMRADQAPFPGGCFTVLSPDAMNIYFKASTLTGWKLIYGLNLGQNSPPWALRFLTEGALQNGFPPQLSSVEIGNEPDRYANRAFRSSPTGPTIRAPGYSHRQHALEHLAHTSQIRSDLATASLPLSGPSYSGSPANGNTGWRDNFLGDFIDGVGAGNLESATIHSYATLRQTPGGQPVTIPILLSRATSDHWFEAIGRAAETARARGVSVRLTETNSANQEGLTGVSDTMASALWGLAWLFDNAQLGLRGLNFHTGASAPYNAIQVTAGTSGGVPAYTNRVQPLYYAMYLFSRAAGQNLLPVVVSSSAHIRAYATSECTTCAVNVFVVNKDLTTGGDVALSFTRPMGSASIQRLSAPDLFSLTLEVTLGGQRFDSAGKLTGPIASETVAPDGGVYRFSLPVASAVHLTIPRLPPNLPAIDPGGVINAASYSPLLAPGGLATVFGQNLAFTTKLSPGDPWPTILGGSSLNLADAAAPLYFASPRQVSFQIPWEVEGRIPLTAGAGSGAATETVNIVTYAPAIFTATQTGSGQGSILLGGTGILAAPESLGGRPAKAGTPISIFCTGFGPVNNQPPTGVPAPYSPLASTTTLPQVLIGGQSAAVSYSGLAPGYVGLYQINAVVPIASARGDAVPVDVSISGHRANLVTIAVTDP